MKKVTIFALAKECKRIADNEIRLVEVINRNGLYRSLEGDVSSFEKSLKKLCESIKEKYPAIHSNMKKHMDNYNSSKFFHQGAIEAILDCLIALEELNSSGGKKIFVSHASADAIIVNAFVKEILMPVCGYKSNDIFCTLNHNAIRTGDDFRNEIIANMKSCDFIICMISDNYRKSEVCQNEMGAAWALEGKRILSFKFPNISYNEIGFLNEVKQCADITDKSKLDELYKELCEFYGLEQDWMDHNKRTSEFIKTVSEIYK